MLIIAAMSFSLLRAAAFPFSFVFPVLRVIAAGFATLTCPADHRGTVGRGNGSCNLRGFCSRGIWNPARLLLELSCKLSHEAFIHITATNLFSGGGRRKQMDKKMEVSAIGTGSVFACLVGLLRDNA